MICLAMRDGPFFDYMLVQYLLLQCWVHWLQYWAFYNTRNATARKSSAFNNVEFSRRVLDSDLFVTWIAWISWTFGSLEEALDI